MAEYTKIETAMAIICDLCGDLYLDDFCPEKNDSGKCGRRKYLEEDAADVAPVVHYKDCAHRTEMGNCGHPRYHRILLSAYPYDFCGYGRQREEQDAEPED